jgi:HK97 family phage prohead protease
MLHHRFVTDAVDQVGDLAFSGIAATDALLEDGFALRMSGADLSRFRNNAPLLWNHDVNSVIGRITSIRATEHALPFAASFATPGASPVADQTRKLLKDGSRSAISIGFDIKERVPIDPQDRRAGMVATKWVLYEISVVAIPVDPAAVVTQRAHGRGAMPMARPAAARVPLSAAVRAAQVAALTLRPPIYRGDAASFAAEMRGFLERDALRRSASRYGRDGFAVRQAEARALARLAGL